MYGNAPTGTIYGWQMLGAGIGMASGAFLGGVLRDLTGDYTLALVCSFVLSLMGTWRSWSYPPRPSARSQVGTGAATGSPRRRARCKGVTTTAAPIALEKYGIVCYETSLIAPPVRRGTSPCRRMYYGAKVHHDGRHGRHWHLGVQRRRALEQVSWYVERDAGVRPGSTPTQPQGGLCRGA